MEDLLGLLIFIIFIGGRLLGSQNGAQKKSAPKPQGIPEPRSEPQTGFPGLPRWLEDVQREISAWGTSLEKKQEMQAESSVDIRPIEVIPKKKEEVKTAFPIHTPEPERTSISRVTLRETSSKTEALFGPSDLKRAVIMKEVLGPPRAKSKRGYGIWPTRD